MDIERRLALLESNLRRTRIFLLGLGLCLLLVGTLAADSPFMPVVAQSVDIKDATNKTVIALKESGDVEVGGSLKVKGIDIVQGLKVDFARVYVMATPGRVRAVNGE